MKRKITIDEHRELLDMLLTPRDRDELDEAASATIHDHAPHRAPKHKVRGVLSILDQLDKENVNRRFTT